MNRIRNRLKIDIAYERGITGRNIGIAILDTGIYNHIDFCKPYARIIEFIDFINGYKKPYDDNGHGTHVAGIIGGSGYNCSEIYRGVAPQCNMIVMKVLDENGMGTVMNVVNALKWIIKNKTLYNIRIVNLSVGTYGVAKSDISKLMYWVEKAWDSGLIILTAAGNKGPKAKSITAPGTSKKIITVGTSEEKMVTKEKLKKVVIKSFRDIDRIDNILMDSTQREYKFFSGRGPTKECIVKPEVVAPGNNIVSCCNFDNVYTLKSGTSMSTPIVSGIIALILEWGERNHTGRRISNKDIKISLLETSNSLSSNMKEKRNTWGWGEINLLGLLDYFCFFQK